MKVRVVDGGKHWLGSQAELVFSRPNLHPNTHTHTYTHTHAHSPISKDNQWVPCPNTHTHTHTHTYTHSPRQGWSFFSEGDKLPPEKHPLTCCWHWEGSGEEVSFRITQSCLQLVSARLRVLWPPAEVHEGLISGPCHSGVSGQPVLSLELHKLHVLSLVFNPQLWACPAPEVLPLWGVIPGKYSHFSLGFFTRHLAYNFPDPLG